MSIQKVQFNIGCDDVCSRLAYEFSTRVGRELSSEYFRACLRFGFLGEFVGELEAAQYFGSQFSSDFMEFDWERPTPNADAKRIRSTIELMSNSHIDRNLIKYSSDESGFKKDLFSKICKRSFGYCVFALRRRVSMASLEKEREELLIDKLSLLNDNLMSLNDTLKNLHLAQTIPTSHCSDDKLDGLSTDDNKNDDIDYSLDDLDPSNWTD